ncbi:MAG: zinc-ribbon domain-containing protein [Proteobacteria bacterium]|nr:zinc-ribbon domain-containing protein [Pseudomonadota bacterium]
MLISCPNCATRYNIEASYLGAQGRAVRCANCANTWHQNPVHAPPPPPMVPANQRHRVQATPQMPPPQQQAYAYPPGYPPPGYPPPGYPPYPPPGYPPYPAPPGYPGAAPQSAPPPKPEMDDESDEAADDDIEMEAEALPDMDDEMPMSMADEGEDDDADDDDAMSQADLDAMFADAEEPAPVSSMVDRGGDDGDDETDDLDDMEDPEPIPQVFTADDDDDEDEDEDEGEGEGGSPIKKIIIIVVLVLALAGIGGAGYFSRSTVMEALGSVLEMVGLKGESLGDGLDIRDTKASRESIGGKDVLVVRGVIANVSEKTRQVPMVTLSLQDLDGKTVQSSEAAPLKTQLNAGEQIGFRIEIKEPSALARGLKVTFSERAKPGAKPAAKAH